MKFLFSLFAIAMLTESCNSTKESVTSDNSQQKEVMVQNTLSGTYNVEQISANTSFSEKLSITFDDASNKVSGFSGCNTFFGNYTTDGSTINFSNIAASKKYCPGEKNNLERQFLNALKNTNTFSINDTSVSFSKENIVLLKAKKNVAERPSKRSVIDGKHDKTIITYKTLSRESFEYIQISKDDIKITEDRSLKDFNTYTCKSEDWQTLETLLKDIDIDNLDSLRAPTEKRLYDGAGHATLSIIRGDVETMTPSFDHGTPPKEIEALVNKVLSINENVTKH